MSRNEIIFFRKVSPRSLTISTEAHTVRAEFFLFKSTRDNSDYHSSRRNIGEFQLLEIAEEEGNIDRGDGER